MQNLTLIPSNIGSSCSSFLTTLNTDSSLSSCVGSLINATQSFSPTSDARWTTARSITRSRPSARRRQLLGRRCPRLPVAVLRRLHERAHQRSELTTPGPRAVRRPFTSLTRSRAPSAPSTRLIRTTASTRSLPPSVALAPLLRPSPRRLRPLRRRALPLAARRPARLRVCVRHWPTCQRDRPDRRPAQRAFNPVAVAANNLYISISNSAASLNAPHASGRQAQGGVAQSAFRHHCHPQRDDLPNDQPALPVPAADYTSAQLCTAPLHS